MRPEMIRQRLEKGIVVICRGHGNSMTPVMRDGHLQQIVPAKEAEVGDIVFCKVHGMYYDHWVKAKNPKRGYLIANNHGHVNGWTKQIFGIVTKV
jgi:phage repressor protein C with HTH and peptisase S24 domain